MKKNILWISAAGILLIVFGTIYTVVQQSQRNDANYPQIQIAEDTAASLNAGAQPNSLVQGRVDLENSLAPFVVIYSLSGQTIAGSGYLNGVIPTIPLGVLTAAKGKAYNFVSWQPQSDVRIASVSVAANKYYVLSGRSLKEVEKNESKTFDLTLLGFALSVIILGIAYVVYPKKSK